MWACKEHAGGMCVGMHGGMRMRMHGACLTIGHVFAHAGACRGHACVCQVFMGMHASCVWACIAFWMVMHVLGHEFHGMHGNNNDKAW